MSRKRKEKTKSQAKKAVEAAPDGVLARAGSFARDNPVAAGGAVLMALTGSLIVANAVGFQSGSHPAPLFETRERARALTSGPDPKFVQRSLAVSALVLDVQNALRRMDLYIGPLDGMKGPATERAIRQAERMLGRVETGEATEELLASLLLYDLPEPASNDPVTELLQGGDVDAAAPVPRPKPGQRYASLQAPAPAVPTPAVPVSALPEAARSGALPADADRKLAVVQQLLSDLGYGPLAADGLMGANTEMAIQRFQLDRGLPITGEPTPDVIERLERVSGQTITF
ncbi:peptidoglycan-binding domain-containing protein [Roseibium sp. RKSG952]|uniref:peptidoglycan-binding domain-containing protein n=1 Tax=Roseibium sp. RKSG952 TaxID=2529384 RepID=UPI0012BCDCB3|nr:peptidoglycan-binding domain-containing protein [Roseibium sp. RKSG952]MTH97283.1 peptidoglycan-binding protein [Roseibium sp. RKSG952]